MMKEFYNCSMILNTPFEDVAFSATMGRFTDFPNFSREDRTGKCMGLQLGHAGT